MSALGQGTKSLRDSPLRGRHTCKRVRDGVGDLLFKAGVPVWL
jgi:hypothetical protein